MALAYGVFYLMQFIDFVLVGCIGFLFGFFFALFFVEIVED